MDDPGPAEAPDVEKRAFTHQQADQASGQILQRWQSIARETYAVAAAKKLALSGKMARTTGQEHGTEWGTVIHILLQAAIQNPTAELHPVAKAALAEVGLPVDLAGEAVQVVQAEVKSDLWRRAMASSQRLVEVPFQVMLPSDAAGRTIVTPSSGEAPPSGWTVVRGMIDLVFLEQEGWVIVDHKTDAAAATDVANLVEYYSASSPLRRCLAKGNRPTG